MKVTEPGLNTLIDNLNTLICQDNLLTRKERETLVLAVAAIGAMKARVGMKKPAIPAEGRETGTCTCPTLSECPPGLGGRRGNFITGCARWRPE